MQEVSETWSSIPGLGRFLGDGHGNPLQYSCLENPMDRGAWQATVLGAAKSWKRLKQLSCMLLITVLSFHLPITVSRGQGQRVKMNQAPAMIEHSAPIWALGMNPILQKRQSSSSPSHLDPLILPTEDAILWVCLPLWSRDFNLKRECVCL